MGFLQRIAGPLAVALHAIFTVHSIVVTKPLLSGLEPQEGGSTSNVASTTIVMSAASPILFMILVAPDANHDAPRALQVVAVLIFAGTTVGTTLQAWTFAYHGGGTSREVRCSTH